MSDPLVKPRHMRAARICAAGSRRWFLTAGLDWNRFVSEGIPASEIEAKGSAVADRACAVARREAEADGQG